ANLEALVLAELRVGAHAELDRERQRLACSGEVADVQLRLADRCDARRVDRVHVPATKRAAQRLVEHRLAAEATDHDRWRHLALAKSRDPHLATKRLRSLLDAALDFLRGDLGL